MTYCYEQLGEKRFQQICQAILTTIHSGIQCFPVGMPDGGRDAIERVEDGSQSAGFIVFQVKFVVDPTSRSAREEVEKAIKSEKKKVKQLIKKGAKKYFLITNVGGTSHLEDGSIDKVNKALSAAFGVPSQCLWRDDLDRRIDAHSDIKWSYPEILRGSDVLQALIEGKLGAESRSRLDTVRSYVAYQHSKDVDLKFKQIDFSKGLIPMFVDIPGRIIPPSSDIERKRWEDKCGNNVLLESLAAKPEEYGDEFIDGTLSPNLNSAQMLLMPQVVDWFPFVVLEGGPGQGKSTITQFLCQSYRLLLLGMTDEIDQIPVELRPISLRLPFKVDLRDYASWVSGYDPFDGRGTSKLPPNTSSSLESFLAAQISNQSGGNTFSVNDLTQLVRSSQILLVLDGFDEVADVPTRNKLVAEITDACTRLYSNALSLQVIVTSRPVAFINSKNFARDQWQHLEILSLSRLGIEQYMHKWMLGRSLDAVEQAEIRMILFDKLSQPHVRELARNPMQLAILLSLISTQGSSLPDKRTQLYDRYVDIFFNREAEKSRLVREHRETLINVHRYVAWTLHSEAEVETANGRVQSERLRQLVRGYLEDKGHEISLFDSFFDGMLERIGALISRVKGTYEFEVQPLREYFAARFLYDTAPSSPASEAKPGGLPERFRALASNVYWLNVTRFYCGCYTGGELASLIDGLDEIWSDPEFSLIDHIPTLSSILLSDYVFGQQPRLVDKICERLFRPRDFEFLLASVYDDRIQLRYSSSRASSALISKCKAKLTAGVRFDQLHAISQILRANASEEAVRILWKDLYDQVPDKARWLQIGAYLNVYSEMPSSECVKLIHSLGINAALFIIATRRAEPFDIEIPTWDLLLARAASGRFVHVGNTWLQGPSGIYPALIKIVSHLLSRGMFDGLSHQRHRSVARAVRNRFREPNDSIDIVEVLDGFKDHDNLPIAKPFYSAILRFVHANLDRQASEPVFELVEEMRRAWGDTPGVIQFAVSAARFLKFKDDARADLIDSSVPLSQRLACANFRAEQVDWWKEQLTLGSRKAEKDLIFVLIALFELAKPSVVLGMSHEIARALDALTPESWEQFAERIISLNDYASDDRGRSEVATLLDLTDMSVRLVSCLVFWIGERQAVAPFASAFSGYECDDHYSNVAYIRVLLAGVISNPDKWQPALRLVKEGPSSSVGYLNTSIWEDEVRNAMPAEIAREICSESTQYPLQYICIANSTLSRLASERAMPVSVTAQAQGWTFL
jgi:hypothetical protein